MRKKHTAEQIVGKLREAELELAKGLTIGAVVRKLGITEQTYYRWPKEHGGVERDNGRENTGKGQQGLEHPARDERHVKLPVAVVRDQKPQRG